MARSYLAPSFMYLLKLFIFVLLLSHALVTFSEEQKDNHSNDLIITGLIIDETLTKGGKVDLSVFKFVALKDLLEIETGFTSNEPAQLAVLEAIEKAVHTTIIEGALQGLWQFKDPQQAKTIIADYQQEKTSENIPYTPPVFDTESTTLVK